MIYLADDYISRYCEVLSYLIGKSAEKKYSLNFIERTIAYSTMISELERSNVTTIAFSSYENIYQDIFKDTKKEYVIYTKNEKDENDNITVYVSNVDRSSGDPKLVGVDDEEEWNRVKDVLRELSKSE